MRKQTTPEISARTAISALRASANGIIIVGVDGTILWANPAIQDLTGYSPGELIGQHTRILKSGTHDQAFYEDLWKTVTSGRAWKGVIVNRRKDGSCYSEEQTITPVLEQNGAIGHFVAIKQDVTRRLATERELFDAHRRFNAFMDNSPAVAFIKDAEGRYLYMNETFEALLGFRRADLIGKTDLEIWPPHIAEQFRRNDQEVLREGKPRQLSEISETADGTSRSWLVLKFPVTNVEDKVVLGGVAVDVTDLQRAEDALRRNEAQLRQAQKLDAVGRLAAGVAHDFNNLLTAILGYSQLIRTHLPADSAARKDVNEIQHAAERATNLTRQLLMFSRKQEIDPRVVDLNEILRSMSRFLERLIGEEIAVVLEPRQDLWPVKVDRGHIEQVILNLAVNARDAMPGGGRLTIGTSHLELSGESAIDHPGMRPGRYAMLEVADTGCGMDQETLARLFEPFFTTKGPDRGTGLGLSIVHGIIHQHGGHIEVTSTPGRGSSFRVYLPRTEERLRASPGADLDSESCHGSEHVLIVEDEEIARKVTAEILRRYGYKVAEARDGEEALRWLEAEPARPDLALIDLILPGMSGSLLAERLRRLHTGLRVLYMSGYDARTLPADALPRDGSSRLQKPVAADLLLLKVREALDRPPVLVSAGGEGAIDS